MSIEGGAAAAGTSDQPRGMTMTMEQARPRKVTVYRDTIYTDITLGKVLDDQLHVDGDVWILDDWSDPSNPRSIRIFNNLSKYIVNGDFESTGTDLDIRGIPTVESAKRIDTYLRRWGKIPEFLELRISPGKGYGIFAKENIPPNTYLGIYEGIMRQTINPTNKYVFSVKNFANERVSYSIDAENLVYANFTRFVNDGDVVNCVYVQHGYQVTMHTAAYISAGSELTGSYGDDYWKVAGREKKRP